MDVSHDPTELRGYSRFKPDAIACTARDILSVLYCKVLYYTIEYDI